MQVIWLYDDVSKYLSIFYVKNYEINDFENNENPMLKYKTTDRHKV